MKNLTVASFCLILTLALFSCGGEKPAKADKPVKKEAKTEIKKEEPKKAPVEIVEETPSDTPEETKTLDLSAGEAVYTTKCIACHQPTGQGLPGAFPPLAGSDYLLSNKKRALNIALNGLTGEITVNGTTYNSAMPPAGLSNDEAIDVVNYILNSWGNEGGTVTSADLP